MKRLFLPLLLSATAALAAGEGASTPQITASGSHVYGEAMPLGRPAAIGSVLDDAGPFLRRRAKFEGRITQVCQNKGCWLVLADGERSARVFTNHAFFLPMDSSGNAVVYGTLGQRTLSESFARHLAEDAGDDPSSVSGPQVEYRIDAYSVELQPAG
ncbi:MAG: DUF4920 domain-containing protein [Xanthomonadales bacterium]|nr:DUF4920 domain-containing protein [Xanthomonadales bacterium]